MLLYQHLWRVTTLPELPKCPPRRGFAPIIFESVRAGALVIVASSWPKIHLQLHVHGYNRIQKHQKALLTPVSIAVSLLAVAINPRGDCAAVTPLMFYVCRRTPYITGTNVLIKKKTLRYQYKHILNQHTLYIPSNLTSTFILQVHTGNKHLFVLCS
jgi:hypothetical protein